MFAVLFAADEIPMGKLREIHFALPLSTTPSFALAVTFLKCPNCSHKYDQTTNIGKIFVSLKLVPEGIHNIGQHKIILRHCKPAIPCFK